MDIRSQSIEQLGLVAGLYEELGIGELIDELVPQDHAQRKLSVGMLVKAMVLNGLGFSQRRLYLCGKFFSNKPTEVLLGEGVTSELINDDALGRALDKLYDYGVTELFAFIARKAVKVLALRPKVAHDDVTSFHVDGNYPVAAAETVDATTMVHIERGYSRDHRPDLKQIALELIVEQQASLPIAMRVASGNSNDKLLLAESVDKHIGQLQQLDIAVCVKDSAGYSQASLQEHQDNNLAWVMRVPETLAAAKQLKAQVDISQFAKLSEGYSYLSLGNSYAGVKQRWLLISSQAAANRARQQLGSKLLRKADKDIAVLNKLSKQTFACAKDAENAVANLSKQLRCLQLAGYQVITRKHFASVGRPAKDAVPTRYSYQLECYPAMATSSFEQAVNQASLFILASDILDETVLSDLDLLTAYKDNSKVETGFRFLKDPSFAANTLLLKNTKRIIALLMVMTLCLLVYAAIQHRVRSTLVKQNLYLPNQKGKPTQRPSAKWVFELFQDVHIVSVYHQQHTLNLIPELYTLLAALGALYLAKYPSSP